MSYIGQRPVVGRYIKLDQISSGFNGSNTSFSMTSGSQAVFPGTARNLLLSLGGVIQEPDTSFTISGSTLTFTTAPVANTTFFAVIFGDMQSTGTPSDGTVLPASIASSGNFSFPQLTVTGTSSLGDDVTFTGANYNVVWDKSDNALEFADNTKAIFGTGGDGELYHDGSHTYLKDVGTGNLRLASDSTIVIQKNTGGETIANFIPDGAVELYYDNSKKLETTSDGATISGITTTTNSFRGNDNVKLDLGTGSDLQIFHNGTNSHIHSATGELDIRSDDFHLRNAANNENIIVADANGAVELYYDNAKKLQTTANGIEIPSSQSIFLGGKIDMTDSASTSTGRILLGTGDDLQIYHDGSNSFVQHLGTGGLYIDSLNNSADLVFRSQDNINMFTNSASQSAIDCVGNGGVLLYHQGTKKFETQASGITVQGAVFALGTTPQLRLNTDTSDGSTTRAMLGMASANNNFVNGSTVNDVVLNCPKDFIISHGTTELMAHFKDDSSVELYCDASKKFETTSAGVQVSGSAVTLEDSAGTVISFDESGTRKAFIGIRSFAAHDGDGIMLQTSETAPIKFAINNVIKAKLDSNGDFVPGSNNASNLGTSSNRWSDVYIADDIYLNDDGLIRFGTSGSDMLIQHTGNNNFIEGGSGFSGNLYIRAKLNENGIILKSDNAVELYYDASLKLTTQSTGVRINSSGSSHGLFVHHSNGNEVARLAHGGSGDEGVLVLKDSANTTVLLAGENGQNSHIAGPRRLHLGSSVDVGASQRGIELASTTTGNPVLIATSSSHYTSGAYSHYIFYSASGTAGTININGTSTTYNTSSDYRLKENQVSISDGIIRLKQLKPYRFNWIDDPTNTPQDGFFAHEAQAVVPEAVSGTKDEMKSFYYEEGDTIPDGKAVGDFKEYSTTEINPQQIDQSKLIPLLTAALQEAITKIETLETKVAALEVA